jgi:hypothetical protein
VEAVRALTGAAGYLCEKNITHMLGLHDETVKRILRKDLNMRKVNFEWVLDTQDIVYKGAQVEISRELLKFLQRLTDQSLCNMYTWDET